MPEALIGLVITLIIVGAILWLLVYLVDHLPMVASFPQVAKAIILLVGVLILIYLLLGFLPGHGMKFGC